MTGIVSGIGNNAGEGESGDNSPMDVGDIAEMGPSSSDTSEKESLLCVIGWDFEGSVVTCRMALLDTLLLLCLTAGMDTGLSFTGADGFGTLVLLRCMGGACVAELDLIRDFRGDC